MRVTRTLELKVGLFINLGIALLVAALLILGGRTSLFSKRADYEVAVPNAGGLLKGAKVMLAGVQVGAVKGFDLTSKPPAVRVLLSIPAEYASLIRADSTAEVVTEGVVGDRVVEITPGSPSAPILPPGGEIAFRKSVELYRLPGKAEDLLVELREVARRLNTILGSKDVSEALKGLNRVIAKIDHGSGTLGALLNDPALYDDAKALLGEANENRMVRNLVRKAVEDSRKSREPAGRK